jgi:FkbM family methyltransferase
VLSETIGSRRTEDAIGDYVRSDLGKPGHAVWGPYEHLDAGDYQVEFLIRLAGSAKAALADELIAVVDVATDNGRSSSSYDFIFASQLTGDFSGFALPFRLDEPATVEYRVYVTGAESVDVAAARTVRALKPGEVAWVVPAAGTPNLLVAHRGDARALCDSGGSLRLSHGRLQAQLGGITFAADKRDDINFVDELFHKKAYNFVYDRASCVVDVGMNVALASLLFATKPTVREIHAFEPFTETFDRAACNLALNPSLAERINAHNYGLGDGDQDATFFVGDTNGDSGGQSTHNVEGGRPVTLKIRDAGTVLRPILKSARGRGLLTIVKIDCEGAEFEVFSSITRAGLWVDIDFLMVEWHRVFEGRTQDELITPLRAAGFLVLDVSPDEGNGFFYAARMANATSRRGPLGRLFDAIRSRA